MNLPLICTVLGIFFCRCYATRVLPSGPLNMGYSSVCDPAKIIRGVKSGVNVVFWFSIDLADDNGQPVIIPNSVQPLPNISCIVEVATALRNLNLPTTHMVTIGGWGAEHPTTSFSAEDMWAAWKEWNLGVVEAAGLPGGFDGIDWDMEGANDPEDPNNVLAMDMLNLVGEMSQLAKQDGFIVTMVPAESYLDSTTSLYDTSLLHSYPEWEGIMDFNYHGRNGFAFLLTKFRHTSVTKDTHTALVDTFDLVSIQLYESYTHFNYNLTAAPEGERQSAASYLVQWVPMVVDGWYVDFAADPTSGLDSQMVYVNRSNLCIGIANGWADNKKTVMAMPDDVGEGYESLKDMGYAPRGFFFWALDNEGDIPAGQEDPLYMSSGLNDFLHTRSSHPTAV